MVDIAVISGLATVLTTARRLLRDLKEKNLSSQHAALVDQAMEVVTDANERLFAVQSALVEMQQENHSLKSQLATVKDWTARLAKYELVRGAGGALVYKSTADPVHYACPRCVESKKEIHFLRPGASYVGHYSCPSCTEQFRVDFIPSTLESYETPPA